LGTSFVETGFILRRAPAHDHSPDVSFLVVDRIPPGGVPSAGIIPGPPTLAVEVVSPEDRDGQINDKVEDYLAAGTRRVWVVRPKRKSVTVHHPDGTARTLTGDGSLSSDDAGFAIEGFSLPLSDIFAD
jgi:Uma2 family endonuclease